MIKIKEILMNESLRWIHDQTEYIRPLLQATFQWHRIQCSSSRLGEVSEKCPFQAAKEHLR